MKEPTTEAGRQLLADFRDEDGEWLAPWRVRGMILAIEAESAADALRERDEAVRLLRELSDAVTALEQRSIASGGEFETWTEERWVTSIRDEARAFLRRFEGEPG